MHYSSFGAPCTCILNLPKDDVSISFCIASNDKLMIQNWKWHVRKWLRPNFIVPACVCRNQRKNCQDSRCLGLDENQVPPL